MGGQVTFRPGPVYLCAKNGGFGILDEINMAKNEALAVLHATLDFRRAIDVPGYDRVEVDPAARFIGTMNYGYAGTRELNEALTSRFVVIQMPTLGDLLQGPGPAGPAGRAAADPPGRPGGDGPGHGHHQQGL